MHRCFFLLALARGAFGALGPATLTHGPGLQFTAVGGGEDACEGGIEFLRAGGLTEENFLGKGEAMRCESGAPGVTVKYGGEEARFDVCEGGRASLGKVLAVKGEGGIVMREDEDGGITMEVAGYDSRCLAECDGFCAPENCTVNCNYISPTGAEVAEVPSTTPRPISVGSGRVPAVSGVQKDGGATGGAVSGKNITGGKNSVSGIIADAAENDDEKRRSSKSKLIGGLAGGTAAVLSVASAVYIRRRRQTKEDLYVPFN